MLREVGRRRRHLARRHRAGAAAVDRDLALARDDDAREQLQQRRLAGTVAADQRDPLARVQGRVETVEHARDRAADGLVPVGHVRHLGDDASGGCRGVGLVGPVALERRPLTTHCNAPTEQRGRLGGGAGRGIHPQCPHSLHGLRSGDAVLFELGGARERLVDRQVPHRRPVRHQHDRAGVAGDELGVVLDRDDRDALAIELGEALVDLLGASGVELGDGLVDDDDGRLQRKRPGKRRQVRLATGQLPDVATGDPGDAEGLQCGVRVCGM